MSYPHKLHFGSRPRPQLNLGRRGSTKLRADGLPLWSGGVPRVNGMLLVRTFASSSPPPLRVCPRFVIFASVLQAASSQPDKVAAQTYHATKRRQAASTRQPSRETLWPPGSFISHVEIQ